MFTEIKQDTDRLSATYFDFDTGIATYILVDHEPLDPRVEYGAAEDDPDTESYFAGEVYGIVVVDQDSEILIDFWGVYGWDFAKDEARSEHNYYVKVATDAAEDQRAEDEHSYQLAIGAA